VPPSANPTASQEAVTPGQVLRLWSPLAFSWLLMAFELPIVTMAIARLVRPEVNLAAHGAVVMPVSLIVEAPIMMMLAASTALCRDGAAYRLVWRVMSALSFMLTALHALIAFTPLHDFVVLELIGAPSEVLEPARLGLQLMLPWTWAIAHRRFHQGLLIRAGRSRPVALGTIVRLGANASVLVLGVQLGRWPGVAVAAVAISAGVVGEALFVRFAARRVVSDLARVEPAGERLSYRAFTTFYVPLALTQVLSLAIPPIGAAAMSRMPLALTSLAAWPAAWGLTFLMRAPAYAFNEVVVSLADRPGGFDALRRFAHRLAAVMTVLLIVFVASPLAGVWFERISGLEPELAKLARAAVLLSLLHPALGAFEMWFQGRLLQARRTRAITVGMVIHLATACLGYGLGIAWGPLPGLLFAVLVLSAASAAKTAWLGWSLRGVQLP